MIFVLGIYRGAQIFADKGHRFSLMKTQICTDVDGEHFLGIVENLSKDSCLFVNFAK